MPKRIVIFCTRGAGRHKWRWTKYLPDAAHPERDVWDRLCVRCGYWYIDVLGDG